jgi:hypothetical protein
MARCEVTKGIGLLALLGCGALAGCSQPAGPTLAPVRGQVFVNGRPAANAFVVLHPLDNPDPQAPRPRGRVDAQGNFVLGTRADGDGALPGAYAVTIQWFNNTRAKEGDERGPNAASDLLRGRYSNPNDSRALRVRVEPGPNQLPPFKL